MQSAQWGQGIGRELEPEGIVRTQAYQQFCGATFITQALEKRLCSPHMIDGLPNHSFHRYTVA